MRGNFHTAPVPSEISAAFPLLLPGIRMKAAAHERLCGSPGKKEMSTESSRLEETFMTIKSKHQPSPAPVAPRPHHPAPDPDAS